MKPVTGKINRRQNVLESSTVRNFGGGWNVIDNEFNLSSKYQTVLRNLYRYADGTLGVRYGTRLFSDLANTVTGRIINTEYYANYIIAVTSTGQIAAINGLGDAVKIWDDDMANALPDSPSGWNETAFVTFAHNKNNLTLHNGIDKPLKIGPQLRVEYLQDEADLTNINTPIGNLAVTHKNFLVVGGDPLNPGLLHISQEGAGGTFLGDAAPNNAVQFDLSSYVVGGSVDMIGLTSFRDRLLVAFENAIVVVNLGTFADDVHIPEVIDVIGNHGAISNRTISDLGDEMFFCDLQGVPSIQRALFTGSLQPQRVSQLVDPEIQFDLGRLSALAKRQRVFSIYNRLEGQYSLFIPSDSDVDGTWQSRGFVYTSYPAMKVKAWSEFSNWNWSCGCVSQQGRVFYGKETKIYIYGSDNDPIYGDYENEQEEFDDGTSFNDDTGFTPVSDGSIGGISIPFVWEMPWADFDKRMQNKHTRYVAMDVNGSGRFTLEGFVDQIYEDRSDTGELFSDETDFDDGFGFIRIDPILQPELSMDFVGGDQKQFGADFGIHFGGGRTTNEELLYAWTTKCRIVKMRISGRTKKPLRFVSLSLMYQDGSIRR